MTWRMHVFCSAHLMPASPICFLCKQDSSHQKKKGVFKTRKPNLKSFYKGPSTFFFSEYKSSLHPVIPWDLNTMWYKMSVVYDHWYNKEKRLFGVWHNTGSAPAVKSPNNCDFSSHLSKRNSKTTGGSNDSTNTGIDRCDTPATGSAATSSP